MIGIKKKVWEGWIIETVHFVLLSGHRRAANVHLVALDEYGTEVRTMVQMTPQEYMDLNSSLHEVTLTVICDCALASIPQGPRWRAQKDSILCGNCGCLHGDHDHGMCPPEEEQTREGAHMRIASAYERIIGPPPAFSQRSRLGPRVEEPDPYMVGIMKRVKR